MSGCPDVATDNGAGVENTQLGAWFDNRTPAVLLNIQRQPGANVISTVDQIKKALPRRSPPPCPRAMDGKSRQRSHHRHPGLGAPTSNSN